MHMKPVNTDHPLKSKFSAELQKVKTLALSSQYQNFAKKDSIEKLMNLINYESKRNQIPEDKKLMRNVTNCFEAIEKSYQELQEVMLTKLQNFPKLSF